MKNAAISLFVLLFFLPATSYALYTYNGSCESVGQASIAAKKMFKGALSGNCEADGDAVLSSQSTNYPENANCVQCINYDPANCSVFMFYYLCDVAVVSTFSNIEMTVASSDTVTGISPGQEREAAETFFNTFSSAAQLPSVEGRVRTDTARGISYVTTVGEGETETSINVIAWKRGIYTKAGDNPVPLGELSGGSGSGGATAGDIGAAVESASTYKGPSAGDIGAAVESVSSYKGPSADVIGDKVAEKAVGSAGTLGGASYDSSYTDSDELSISTRITSFITGNPIISAINGTHLSLSGAVCTASVGSAFGKPLSFDFCWMEEYLVLFGNLMVAFAGLTAAFIIFRRGD